MNFFPVFCAHKFDPFPGFSGLFDKYPLKRLNFQLPFEKLTTNFPHGRFSCFAAKTHKTGQGNEFENEKNPCVVSKRGSLIRGLVSPANVSSCMHSECAFAALCLTQGLLCRIPTRDALTHVVRVKWAHSGVACTSCTDLQLTFTLGN